MWKQTQVQKKLTVQTAKRKPTQQINFNATHAAKYFIKIALLKKKYHLEAKYNGYVPKKIALLIFISNIQINQYPQPIALPFS